MSQNGFSNMEFGVKLTVQDSLHFERFRRNSLDTDNTNMGPAMFEQALVRTWSESVEEMSPQSVDSYERDLIMKGANLKNLSLVFGIPQISGSPHDLAKGVNLTLRSLHLEVDCVAIGSLFNWQWHDQDSLQSFSLSSVRECRSNETETLKEVIRELERIAYSCIT